MQTLEQVLAENEALKLEIKKLETLNKHYEEQLKLNRQKMFGKSSERTDINQISFFNEAEVEAQPIAIEPELEKITYTRKKQKGGREKLFENLPVEIVEYKVEDKTCPKCNSEMQFMKYEIRRELNIIPAKVYVKEYRTEIAVCRNCEKNDVNATIITAESPKALIPKSFVSANLMAYIMSQKFVNALPLYRQEQDFKRMDINLSRQNLANWMIKGAEILRPLVDKMKEFLLTKDVLHADETTLEVLCEPGRKAEMQSYMWLYRTSGCDEPIVLYDYQQGRSGDFAKKFLKGYNGYLHADGYAGYHKLEPDVTLCGCWAHARRKFHEALKVNKVDATAQKGLDYCKKLFAIEDEIKEKSAEEKFNIRQEKSKPIADEFFNWAEGKMAVDAALPQGSTGKALQYAINQKKYLLSFLKDGRLELSNNRAERSIKPFVMGRKNWLFCNTPNGARSSAIIFSIIETAKENKLKPIEYLTFVFEQYQKNKNIDTLLPWSDEIPENCKMKN